MARWTEGALASVVLCAKNDEEGALRTLWEAFEDAAARVDEQVRLVDDAAVFGNRCVPRGVYAASGDTLLHLFVRNGASPTVVDELLSRGARLDVANGEGESALELSRRAVAEETRTPADEGRLFSHFAVAEALERSRAAQRLQRARDLAEKLGRPQSVPPKLRQHSPVTIISPKGFVGRPVAPSTGKNSSSSYSHGPRAARSTAVEVQALRSELREVRAQLRDSEDRCLAAERIVEQSTRKSLTKTEWLEREADALKSRVIEAESTAAVADSERRRLELRLAESEGARDAAYRTMRALQAEVAALKIKEAEDLFTIDRAGVAAARTRADAVLRAAAENVEQAMPSARGFHVAAAATRRGWRLSGAFADAEAQTRLGAAFAEATIFKRALGTDGTTSDESTKQAAVEAAYLEQADVARSAAFRTSAATVVEELLSDMAAADTDPGFPTFLRVNGIAGLDGVFVEVAALGAPTGGRTYHRGGGGESRRHPRWVAASGASLDWDTSTTNNANNTTSTTNNNNNTTATATTHGAPTMTKDQCWVLRGPSGEVYATADGGCVKEKKHPSGAPPEVGWTVESLRVNPFFDAAGGEDEGAAWDAVRLYELDALKASLATVAVEGAELERQLGDLESLVDRAGEALDTRLEDSEHMGGAMKTLSASVDDVSAALAAKKKRERGIVGAIRRVEADALASLGSRVVRQRVANDCAYHHLKRSMDFAACVNAVDDLRTAVALCEDSTSRTQRPTKGSSTAFDDVGAKLDVRLGLALLRDAALSKAAVDADLGGLVRCARDILEASNSLPPKHHLGKDRVGASRTAAAAKTHHAAEEAILFVARPVLSLGEYFQRTHGEGARGAFDEPRLLEATIVCATLDAVAAVAEAFHTFKSRAFHVVHVENGLDDHHHHHHLNLSSSAAAAAAAVDDDGSRRVVVDLRAGTVLCRVAVEVGAFERVRDVRCARLAEAVNYHSAVYEDFFGSPAAAAAAVAAPPLMLHDRRMPATAMDRVAAGQVRTLTLLGDLAATNHDQNGGGGGGSSFDPSVGAALVASLSKRTCRLVRLGLWKVQGLPPLDELFNAAACDALSATLEHVRVEMCDGALGAGIPAAHLAKLRKLETIALIGASADRPLRVSGPLPLRALAGLKRLLSLRFVHTAMGGGGGGDDDDEDRWALAALASKDAFPALLTLEIVGHPHFRATVPSFANLKKLETARLADNGLTGAITADFYGPALRELDVRNNDITGLAPPYAGALERLLLDGNLLVTKMTLDVQTTGASSFRAPTDDATTTTNNNINNNNNNNNNNKFEPRCLATQDTYRCYLDPHWESDEGDTNPWWRISLPPFFDVARVDVHFATTDDGLLAATQVSAVINSIHGPIAHFEPPAAAAAKASNHANDKGAPAPAPALEERVTLNRLPPAPGVSSSSLSSSSSQVRTITAPGDYLVIKFGPPGDTGVVGMGAVYVYGRRPTRHTTR